MVATGFAQSTGSIRGTVKNESNGKLLSNASVVIQGTNRSASTDEYGVYRFNGIAPGEYTVEASFVGLANASINVSVDSAISSGADIVLRSNRYTGVDGQDVYELETFEVGNSDYNGLAIAQNERKNSASYKLVQDAEALGDIAEGNIGEFLKNLPGVAIDYTAADPRSIKLRGMGANFTNVTIDGGQMASAASSGKDRKFELEQVSLSNVEFLEVTKLRRADQAANAMGGSVNLVSKNAFAQGGRVIKYKTYLNFNSTEGFDLDESPGWMSDVSHHHTVPGYEISYSDVFIEDKLGASFTISESNMFNPQKRTVNGQWRRNTDGSVAHDGVTIQDGPKFTQRRSLAANFDYKHNESTVIALRTQGNTYDAEFGNRNFAYKINEADYDYDASSEGVAIGGVNLGSKPGGSNRNKFGSTYHVDLGVKHNFGNWRVDYGKWVSEATNHYRQFASGYASSVIIQDIQANGDVERMRLTAANGTSEPLYIIEAWDSNGVALNNGGVELENGRISEIRNNPYDSVATINGTRFNAKYNFNLGENQASVKFGYEHQSTSREANRQSYKWRPTGDAVDLPVSAFEDTNYRDVAPGFGYPTRDYVSFAQVLTYLEENPDQFDYDETSNRSGLEGSYFRMKESVTSYYVMGQFGFNQNKGLLTAGIRREDTAGVGKAPVKGRVEVGEGVELVGDFTLSDADYTSNVGSAHLRYNFTENLIGRLGWAQTIGRQNFNDIFGRATITDPTLDPDPEDEDGSYKVVLANPNLRPRSSDNIDLTMEYYFGDTSLLSASYFSNDIKDYHGKEKIEMTPELLAAAGVTEDLLATPSGGFTSDDFIEYKKNVGEAKISGVELSYNQSLDLNFMPNFLRESSFYWNATFLDIDSDFTGSQYEKYDNLGNLPGFAKDTMSYGFLLARGPASLRFRWNIRGKELGGFYNLEYYDEATGKHLKEDTDYFHYTTSRPTLDINGEYRFNERATLYFSVRNVSNVLHERHIEFDNNGTQPGRTLLRQAEDFGAQWSVGIKGRF